MNASKKRRTRLRDRRRNFAITVSKRNQRRTSGQKPSLWPILYSDIVLISIVMAILSFIFLDQTIAENRGMTNPAIINFFQIITDLGKFDWLLIPSGVFCLLLVFVDWQGLARRQQVWLSGLLFDAWFLFLSVAGSGILVLLFKHLAGRARPVHLQSLGIDYFDPLRFESSFTSFPSGHSVTIAAFAAVLVLRFPKYKFGFILLALAVGISRVMVGAHYPSDVIIGLMIGALFTLFLARLFSAKNIGFKLPEQGPIEVAVPVRRIIRGHKVMRPRDFLLLLKRLVGISS